MTLSSRFVEQLAGDLDARAGAIAEVARYEIAHPDAFAALLRACRDLTPLPLAYQPQVQADPFAGFFGDASPGERRTVARLAADRLAEVGWPGDVGTAEVAARVLAEEEPGEVLVAACVTGLAETVWDDEGAALARLVPVLYAHDAAMYPVIVRQGDAGVARLVAAALSPYRSRAVNELLANGNSHDAMLNALCEAVLAGTLAYDEQQAMAILAQIVAWAGPRAPAVAAAMEATMPWAVVFAALDDADARPRMRAWIDGGGEYPASLPPRLDEALKSRPPVDDYPLEAWLARCDGSTAAIAAWRRADAAADLLRAWVRAGRAAEGDPERAVQAVSLLADVGGVGPVAEDVVALIADPELIPGWTGAAWRRLAEARPAIEGLAAAWAAALRAAPMRAKDVVPALLASEAPPELLREALAGAVADAEAASIKKSVSRRGTRIVREGVDPEALRPLVGAVDDPALRARWEAVLPYLGA